MKEKKYTLLNSIDSPNNLKNMSIDYLPQVCDELREYIIEQLAKNPGHLGSSLGVVELTVALHYVFNTPYDRIVWDVGHQAYGHKILTGRREAFKTNRMFNGVGRAWNAVTSNLPDYRELIPEFFSIIRNRSKPTTANRRSLKLTIKILVDSV